MDVPWQILRAAFRTEKICSQSLDRFCAPGTLWNKTSGCFAVKIHRMTAYRRQMREKVSTGFEFVSWEGCCQYLELKTPKVESTSMTPRWGSDRGILAGHLCIFHSPVLGEPANAEGTQSWGKRERCKGTFSLCKVPLSLGFYFVRGAIFLNSQQPLFFDL